jgi:predicted metal-dependent phosphoesterase TrpH
MNKIDLHMHTTISDGTDTPEELISNVRKAGIDLFSVTDHDACKGGIIIPPMLEKIEADHRPAFIRGVEFSCEDENGKYHILGYGYDPSIPGIVEAVEQGHSLRMSKTKMRLKFLKDRFGLEFPEEKIRILLSMDNPGKPHIAKLIIEMGYAENISDAISKYIDKKQEKEAV